MAQSTKATLGGYFEAGDTPTAVHFGEMISSSLNLAETTNQAVTGSVTMGSSANLTVSGTVDLGSTLTIVGASNLTGSVDMG